MAWDPDSGAGLSADNIRVTDVERTSMSLWDEFLSGWFDGTQHVIRGVEATLPAVTEITYQEQDLPDPKDGLYLHVVTAKRDRAANRLWTDGTYYVSERRSLEFFFRSSVKTPRADGHNSRSLVRWGSDTLYAILQSHLLTYPLSRRGMYAFSVSPPVLISGGDIAMRMVPLSVTYHYSNQETLGAAAPADVAPVVGVDPVDSIVYLGSQRTLRVTSNGLERLASDGNWYIIDVTLLQGADGLVPSLSTTLVE